MLAHNIYWHCQPFCIFSLFLTDPNVRRILVCLAIWYRKKRICIKCTPCNAASCHTYRFFLWMLAKSWLLAHEMRQLTRHCLFVIFWPITPYSPDLAPSDFFLLPKLKRPMKGRRFATIEEIKTALLEELDYTKKGLSEVLWGLEKALAQVYYIREGLFWRGQYRY